MKQSFILTILILVSCFQIFAQEITVCPTIKIIPPSKHIVAEESMLFSVSIGGKFDNSKLEYKWAVSRGTIADGQGTTAILIKTTKDMDGLEVTATIEIKGLPESCKNSFSETIVLPPPVVCRCVIDEYGKASWSDERLRLQNLIVELTNDPKATGLLIFSFKNNSEIDLIFSRQKRILRYLEKNKIQPSQVLMRIIKGEYQTEIRIIP